MAELDWGRRYLMCPPEHFGVLYEINPWMHEEVAVEHDVASQQWNDLVAALRLAGAEVVTMDAHGSSLHKDVERESAAVLATMGTPKG